MAMPLPDPSVLGSVVLACADHEVINASLLSDASFKDAVVCAYTVRSGLTMPVFGAIVMLGIFNLPIYIRQESVLIPFVLSMVLSGILLSSVSNILQGILIVVVLLVIGVGPILLLKRADRP